MPIGLTPTIAKQFVFKLKVTTGSDVTAFFQDTAGSAVFPKLSSASRRGKVPLAPFFSSPAVGSSGAKVQVLRVENMEL